MTTDQLVSEMLSLPDDVRAEVVDRVLLESHGGQASEHKQAWSEEIHHRLEEVQAGSVAEISGDEVSAKIRRIIGR